MSGIGWILRFCVSVPSAALVWAGSDAASLLFRADDYHHDGRARGGFVSACPALALTCVGTGVGSTGIPARGRRAFRRRRRISWILLMIRHKVGMTAIQTASKMLSILVVHLPFSSNRSMWQFRQ